jgi:hypothetical protein
LAPSRPSSSRCSSRCTLPADDLPDVRVAADAPGSGHPVARRRPSLSTLLGDRPGRRPALWRLHR